MRWMQDFTHKSHNRGLGTKLHCGTSRATPNYDLLLKNSRELHWPCFRKIRENAVTVDIEKKTPCTEGRDKAQGSVGLRFMAGWLSGKVS